MPLFASGRTFLLISLIAVVSLNGCSSARRNFDLSPELQTDLKRHGLVSVIARFTTDLEGEIMKGRSWSDPELVDFEGKGRIVEFVGGMRRDWGIPVGTHFQGNDGWDGWIRVLLRPGTYVMRLIPPISSGAQFYWQERWKVLHLYKFTIPPDAEVVYLGSFQAKCRSRKDSFFRNWSCSNKLVRSDERALAARALKSTAGALNTVLARPFENATSGSVGALKQNWPPRFTITNVANLVGPDWDQFNEVQEEVVPGGGGPWGGPELVVVLLPIAIIMLPAILAAEAAKSEAKARWRPCAPQLDSTLRSADLKGTFRRRFQLHAGVATPDGPKTEIASNRADTKAENKNILEANILRVMLRKCREAEKYCIEVAVRMKLRTRVENKILYDAIHVYSTREGTDTKHYYPAGAIHVYNTRKGAYVTPDGYDQSKHYRMWRGHNFWERPLDRISPCRNIADYCGSEGHQLALKEVETALDAIAAKVVRELLQDPQKVK